jgi:hypothetical protein
MFRRPQVEIPLDLRARLEARLDLLALFRALDRLHPAPEQIPQRLIRQLFELDADYVEAIWGLDQPLENSTRGPCSAIHCQRISNRCPLARSIRLPFRVDIENGKPRSKRLGEGCCQLRMQHRQTRCY